MILISSLLIRYSLGAAVAYTYGSIGDIVASTYSM